MKIKNTFVTPLIVACLTQAHAATPLPLEHQPLSVLNTIFNTQNTLTYDSSLKEISREKDRNATTHIRYQQMYAGVPIFGANMIAHHPQGENITLHSELHTTATGTFFQNLKKDLEKKPAIPAKTIQALMDEAIHLFKKETLDEEPVSEKTSQLIIYLDENYTAHWAFDVSFYAKLKNNLPTRPHYILDARTFEMYAKWDDIQTETVTVQAGGFGGNEKATTGKYIYDGGEGHYASFPLDRNLQTHMCFMQNHDVSVQDTRRNNDVIAFSCEAPDSNHNNVYWDGSIDAAHGAYSPGNDALYAGLVIKDMYRKWYGIPVVTKKGQDTQLIMQVHKNIDNAYWDNKNDTMTFGDGVIYFYPLVSLDVGGHEISHGFTMQHAGLMYFGQSGGMNESFSDMAGEAAKFYAHGKNDWQVGATITMENKALRYLDDPTKDCGEDKTPGDNCSISHVKDYKRGLNVHYSSGIYNKVFYLMATAPGWDTKKAFDVMVQANRFYWTALTGFKSGACGVLNAAHDLGYQTDAIHDAFAKVGINTESC